MLRLNSPIILASQSPRRKQLLEWAEVAFEVIVAGTDESYPKELVVEHVPVYIAQQKADAVLQKLAMAKREGLIIAADTVVVLNGEIIGKPNDADHAIAILKRLSGNKHQVITGVYLTDGFKHHSFFDSTDVTFNSMTDSELSYYVNKYQPFDKAGAYAIQEWIGVVGIAAIQGDFYNVMGLPVNKVVSAIKNWQSLEHKMP